MATKLRGNLVYTNAVRCFAFSPARKMLASASYDRSIVLWRSDTGEQIRTLEGQHADWVFSVVFSADGKRLASGAGDGIKLWNVAGGNVVTNLQGQRDVAEVVFSPNGRLLASASSGTVCIWDPRTGKLLETLSFTDGLKSRGNVAADPNVYLKLHHTAMVPKDPSWSDTMSQLAHVGDGFTLEHVRILKNLSASQAATLQIALNRIQTRIAEEDASDLPLMLASRLERAALADVNCDPLEGSLLPWTLRSIRAHVDQPVIRAELERIRSDYTPKTNAQTRFSSIEARVRSYTQRLLAGD